MKTNKKIKILMAAAEAAPLVKVGGLSDVVGSLPKALNKLGCDIRIIMPKYDRVDIVEYGLEKMFSKKIKVGDKTDQITVWQTKKAISGAIVYLIESQGFDGSRVYNEDNNAGRFIFFSTLCLEALPAIGFKPDIVHCHDFHVAFILPLMKTGKYEYLKEARTLYTIHNLKYQGKTEPEILNTADLARDSLVSLAEDAADGDINFMVQGIINSDAVNTVSPTYAQEIMTKEQGAGLERVIRANKEKLSGIINGLDLNFFNPAKDKHISHQYSPETINKKVHNKIDLQRMLGLPESKKIALVGFISRLFWQKGIDLIDEDVIRNSNCQFVFLGSGHEEYENHLKKLESKYPDKVSANIMFDAGLAQKIYAGSDIFLMPSRFEPCGLGQMISMRYGTIVVARATGGIKDTVDSNTGFLFNSLSSKSLTQALKKALDVYYNDSKKWLKLQNNCLKKDFSWEGSAKEYLKLYKKILSSKR